MGRRRRRIASGVTAAGTAGAGGTTAAGDSVRDLTRWTVRRAGRPGLAAAAGRGRVRRTLARYGRAVTRRSSTAERVGRVGMGRPARHRPEAARGLGRVRGRAAGGATPSVLNAWSFSTKVVP